MRGNLLIDLCHYYPIKHMYTNCHIAMKHIYLKNILGLKNADTGEKTTPGLMSCCFVGKYL